MLKILILLILYLICQSNGNANLERMKGGESCPRGKHSYMVAIIRGSVNSFRFVRAGTLLSERWVLTAGLFKINDTPNYYKVIAGATSISEFKSKMKHFRISEVTNFYHIRSLLAENFNIALTKASYSELPNSYELFQLLRSLLAENFNIALMKLKHPIFESNTISYIRWASGPNNMQDRKLDDICSSATIVSFDVDATNATLLENLYCARVPVISKETCANMMPYMTLPPQVDCIFKSDVDVCHGDVGGPVMCNDIQYGVMTAGYGCRAKIPSLISRIDPYEDFIKKKLSESDNRSNKCSSNNFNNLLVVISYFIAYLIKINSI